MPIFGQICVKTANFTPDLGITEQTAEKWFQRIDIKKGFIHVENEHYRSLAI